MSLIERDFDLIFSLTLRMFNYNSDPQNITLKEFSVVSYNYTNQSAEIYAQFEDPFKLGLINEKNDKLYLLVNPEYPMLDVLTNFTKANLTDQRVRMEYWGRVELNFDKDNSVIKFFKWYSAIFQFILGLSAVALFVLAIYYNLSLMQLWTLIEYSQLIAIIPLHTSRYIPWVYYAYKPFVMTHLIFNVEDPSETDLPETKFHSIEFQSIGITSKTLLFDTTVIWFVILGILIFADILSYFLFKPINTWL